MTQEELNKIEAETILNVWKCNTPYRPWENFDPKTVISKHTAVVKWHPTEAQKALFLMVISSEGNLTYANRENITDIWLSYDDAAKGLIQQLAHLNKQLIIKSKEENQGYINNYNKVAATIKKSKEDTEQIRQIELESLPND